MNDLYYSLPEKLRMKIIRMNPHPLADLFKSKMHIILEDLTVYAIQLGNCKSFANSFFHPDGNFISEEAWNIYYYAGMDWQYVSTLNEWNRRNQTMIIPVF